MPAREDMPSTLKRSAKKAQDTYAKTHESTVEEYGEAERAHRTARLDVAERLDIGGRSRTTKSDLIDAIQKANAAGTRQARGG